MKTIHQNLLAVDKFVKIMPDYCSTGVWEKGGSSACVEDLTINPEIVKKLDAWQATYDRQNVMIPISKVELDLQVLRGLEIACMVKKEHPDWVVCLFCDNFDKPIFIEQ